MTSLVGAVHLPEEGEVVQTAEDEQDCFSRESGVRHGQERRKE